MIEKRISKLSSTKEIFDEEIGLHQSSLDEVGYKYKPEYNPESGCKRCTTHHAKMDLNKTFSPKKKNLQTFKVDAKGFRKNRNENVPT